MSSKSHTEHLFYRLGYTSWMFSFLSGLSRIIGRVGCSIIGEITGRFYAVTHPHIVRVVAQNLEILEGRTITNREARKNFRNFSVTMADYIWLSTRSRKDALTLAEIEDEQLRIACMKKCGVILATGHYGFFEYGAIVGTIGFPVSVVTYAEPAPALTRWRAEYRRRWGVETIELGNDAFSSLRATEAIQKGRLTAMLVDRPLGGRSLEVKLPGGCAAFSASPAILSWVTGCAIVPVSVRRMPSGNYRIHASKPIFADRTQLRDVAISTCTKQVAEALITDFRHDPFQWYHFVPLSPAT